MANIISVELHSLVVKENRQRREFKPDDLVKLANSISQNGLLHPVVVRREGNLIVLVAGERRVRAMKYVWNFGERVKCGGQEFEEDQIPCLDIGELDDLAAFEAELEENITRSDLTWQERVQATSQLAELRRLQAQKSGAPQPTINDLAVEIHGAVDSSGASGSATDQVRKELVVSKYLKDADVQKATSADEAFKIIKRKEQSKRNEELAKTVGASITSSSHTLLQGDCIALMRDMADNTFDVVCTDPPYGIDADKYGDSGGMTPGAHFYDDSFKTWAPLMRDFARLTYTVTKPEAHAYVFGDIDNFVMLKEFMAEAGWIVFRTPLIWHNPSGMRAPWPERGPQRKYQICLYAVKGKKPCTKLYGDVLTYGPDSNLGHPAQKPVDLLVDLLRRSVRPGDNILDPFAGSGSIFPAAHSLKCRATGIEMDAAAAGIALGRLGGLT